MLAEKTEFSEYIKKRKLWDSTTEEGNPDLEPGFCCVDFKSEVFGVRNSAVGSMHEAVTICDSFR